MKLKQVETGQLPMALTNNNSEKINNLELSIQIHLSGLSFCVLNRTQDTITYLKHISFKKRLNPLDLLDQLKSAFNKEEALKDDFDSVLVIHDNELAVQVPESLFDENCLADYLKFNSKILKSDFITYDKIPDNNLVNVYIPYININNFIYDLFGSFTFKHKSTILLSEILKKEKQQKELKVYVNVNESHFELTIVETGKLLLYNSFEYHSKEDFIYYILFTTTQLNLDPEMFILVLTGCISEEDELYEITYNYVRHIEFGNRKDRIISTLNNIKPHNEFALLNSF